MRRLLHNRGFTLLEILIASAILAFALVAVLSLQANTLLTSRRAELLTIATMLVDQRMMEVELELQKGIRKSEFPDEKSEDGRFEAPYEDFKWSYEIKRISLPAPVAADEASLQGRIGQQLTEEISKSVRELKVTVTWEEADESEHVELVTHIVKL